QEPGQLEVPVEPPARVLPAEDEQQEGREEDDSRGAPGHLARVLAPVGGCAASPREQPGDDQDRDRGEYPEEGAEPVQITVRVLDREADGVRALARGLRFHVSLLDVVAWILSGRIAPWRTRSPSGSGSASSLRCSSGRCRCTRSRRRSGTGWPSGSPLRPGSLSWTWRTRLWGPSELRRS